MSRQLSLFSHFENGEMSEGQRGSLKFFFGDGLTWDDIFDWHG